MELSHKEELPWNQLNKDLLSHFKMANKKKKCYKYQLKFFSLVCFFQMKSSDMAGAVYWWVLMFPAVNGWLLAKVYTYNPQIKHWRIKQTGCGFRIVRNRTGFTVCVRVCECAMYWMYSAHQPRLHLWNAYSPNTSFHARALTSYTLGVHQAYLIQRLHRCGNIDDHSNGDLPT